MNEDLQGYLEPNGNELYIAFIRTELEPKPVF